MLLAVIKHEWYGFMHRTLATILPRKGIRTPHVRWARRDALAVELRCPNCGNESAKPQKLRVYFHSPDHPAVRRMVLLHCPHCDCAFYDDQKTPDYAEPSMLERGRVPFYVQQGAGVSLITRPLSRVQAPVGSVYLEIGCGYGFGLDYALRHHRWIGRGIDPAGLSALARDTLGLPIELRYFGDKPEPAESCDVVMGSEVLEHIPAPLDFINKLRAMLKPNGILILTTPNGEDITPALPAGTLVPMLSPGLHLVFQTRRSLRHLLEQAGFHRIILETDSHSLVAFASMGEFVLDSDPQKLRSDFRRYLLGRAATTPVGSDIRLGLAGRALGECVNDHDLEGASTAWEMLLEECRTRFNLDIATLNALPEEVFYCDLRRMSELVPLNLASIIYAGTMCDLLRGVPPAACEKRFLLAAKAANAMRRALRALAMEDGMTEDIAWVATGEALLGAASAGKLDTAQRLAAMLAAPVAEDGAARRIVLGQRVFVALVNAGHFALAEQVAKQENLHHAAFTLQPAASHVGLTKSETDCVFALAVLGLNGPGRRNAPRIHLARRRFQRVRTILSSDHSVPPTLDSVLWAALRGEILCCTLQEDSVGAFAALYHIRRAFGNQSLPSDLIEIWQEMLRARFMQSVDRNEILLAKELSELPELAETSDETAALKFARAVLRLKTGSDLKEARERFATLRKAIASTDSLFWPAIEGEVSCAAKQDRAVRATLVLAAILRDQDIDPDLVPEAIRNRLVHRDNFGW